MKKFLTAAMCVASSCLAQEGNPFILPKGVQAKEGAGIPCHHQWKKIEIVDEVLAKNWKNGVVKVTPESIQAELENGAMRVSRTWGMLADVAQNFTFENHYELIYPAEYKPNHLKLESFPTAFEPRNVGVSFVQNFEVQPKHWSIESYVTEFQGYHDYLTQRRAGSPNGIFMPIFNVARSKQQLSENAKSSQILDLKTEKSPATLFLYESHPLPTIAPSAQSSTRFQWSCKVLKVGNETFWNVKNPWTYDGTEYQKWITRGDAELVLHNVGMVEVAKRQSVNSYSEVIYPTEYQESSIEYKQTEWRKKLDKPADGKVSPIDHPHGLAEAWVPSAFEPRITGVMVDLSLNPLPTGLLHLHYSLEHVVYMGRVPHLSLPYQGKWMPHITMPGFVVTRTTAKATIAPSVWYVSAIAPVITSAETREPTHHYLYLIQLQPLP
jgi:hypothetical protein